MKSKAIVTVILLLFVATSVVYLVAKEVGVTADQAAEQLTQPPSQPQPAEESLAPAKVIAYYFHGNARCRTCRTIEAYTRETFEETFAQAMADGRLVWRTVNVEDPGNGHFVEDFQLTTRSVVLELVEDGSPRQWKNLDRVWRLVRDEQAFKKYVRDSAQGYLEVANP